MDPACGTEQNGENTIMHRITTARAFALGLSLAVIAAPAVADGRRGDSQGLQR